MSKEEVADVLWVFLLALSGTILLAPLYPRLIEKETACKAIYGKEWSE